MALRIPLDKLSQVEKDRIIQYLSFEKTQTSTFKSFAQPVTPYEIITTNQIDYVYLPLYWALQNIDAASRPKRTDFDALRCEFKGTLRPLQQEVQKLVLKLLNKNSTCLLSLYTGAGKTITSIYLACKIKLPTLILVHRLILMNQWKESIEKVCPGAKVQIIKTTSLLDETADFYIMNVANVVKKPRCFYKRIGFVIADEVHVMGTEKMSESFLHLTPRYSIGLSATPYRSDGMDKMLFSFFSDQKVHKQLHRNHIVYRVKTNFTPITKLTNQGKLDWNSVIESQTMDIDRNEIIINILKCFKDRTFLILSKRVSQVEYLMRRLLEENIDATSLVGVKKHFNYNSRVLVATVQKAGVGFDHSKLDSLIIASDVEEYFIQYLGRVFRREDTIPIIFDLVDNLKTLQNHYLTRRHIYLDHGGQIKNLILKHIPEQYKDDFKNLCL